MVKFRYVPSYARVAGKDKPANASTETIADLIHRLGDIDPQRILLHPAPGTATEEDLIRLNEGSEPHAVELIDGVLVEKAVGAKESLFGSWLCRMLWNFAEEHDLGVVLGESGPTRFRLGLVRLPDACFISWKRIPGHDFPSHPVSGLIPNLAVEVLSKSNTKREIELKLDEYFAAGVQVTWIIDPKSETARIYISRTRVRELGLDGVLVAPKVLPGFELSLRKVFGAGTRKRRKKRGK